MKFRPAELASESASVANPPRDALGRAYAFWRLARPWQWTKNAFVLVGIVFHGDWDDPPLLGRVLEAFIAFCFASSAVYALNDIADAESDREHPNKHKRPLARGEVSRGAAAALAVALGALALVLAAMVSTAVFVIVAAYLALNLAYSAGLKKAPLLDVLIIAAGFMLRILAGTVGVGIAPSRWLLICGSALTLFLGFCKRRAELDETAAVPRRRAALYGVGAADLLVATSATLVAASYVLYTVSPETILLHGTARLVLTVPWVLYGMIRYLHIVYRNGGGADPAAELLRDPHLLAAVGGWLASTVALIA